MKNLKAFAIPFIGLKQGIHRFDYKIDKSFFDLFEYNEFNDVDVCVDVELNKKATHLEFEFKAAGFVNVNCDLSNERYDQKIMSKFDLVVKFGEVYNADNDEILILPRSEHELNVAQYIYELIILAVPTKRIHPGVLDGTLKSDVLNKLEELSPGSPGAQNDKENTDPRWDMLKKLLTDK